jgi:threonine synthase
MGEGLTPLVSTEGGLRLKLDFLMPTLSFKDRGSVVLVATAAALGAPRLVADSSGNAGASIAAYAARAAIEAEVFVPGTTSEKKVAQLQAYGATVHRVDGSRADTAAAAIERVEATGAFYASHVYNPLFHHGTKTFAFELWEQLGGRLPGTVVVPAGNGTLLIGAAIGFGELVAAGLAERPPRLVAVQAERCAPLARAARAVAGAEPGHDAAGSPGAPPLETAAEGIAIAEPPRLGQMLQVVADSGGTVITAREESIGPARVALAAQGIDVEPTAAATYAAWLDWAEAPPASSVVLAMTGAGLKSPLGTGILAVL